MVKMSPLALAVGGKLTSVFWNNLLRNCLTVALPVVIHYTCQPTLQKHMHGSWLCCHVLKVFVDNVGKIECKLIFSFMLASIYMTDARKRCFLIVELCSLLLRSELQDYKMGHVVVIQSSSLAFTVIGWSLFFLSCRIFRCCRSSDVPFSGSPTQHQLLHSTNATNVKSLTSHWSLFP